MPMVHPLSVRASPPDFDRAAKVAPEMAETAREEQERAQERVTTEGRARVPRTERERGDRAASALEQEAWQLKRYPQAIADLNRALELRPRFAAALTERGLASRHRAALRAPVVGARLVARVGRSCPSPSGSSRTGEALDHDRHNPALTIIDALMLGCAGALSPVPVDVSSRRSM